MSAVHEKVGMPLDEFIRQTNEEMFELINGERIPRLPTITDHNDTIYWLLMMLSAAVNTQNFGIVRPEATYVLPDHYDSNWVTGSRTPDLMFITTERLVAYREANPDCGKTPYLIVPDLVVEVVSPTDKFTEVTDKVDAYLTDGVRPIIVIDPQSRRTFVYAPNLKQALSLSGDDILDFGEVIPGFQIPLPKLFE